jgi:hypothetical protein
MKAALTFSTRRLAKGTFAALPIALLAVALPETAQAQLTLPPTTLNYSFSVPIAKVIPNPCSTGFVFVNGKLSFGIATTDAGSNGFGISATYHSSGQGQDALPDGTLLLNGSSNYLYSADFDSDATFPSKPASFVEDLTITDYLERSLDPDDTFLMNTVFEIAFTNGVPSAPVIQQIDVVCK